jgi:hypothetical protein
MSLRLLSTLAGRVLPVGIVLCVAIISAPADAATKKAAPRGTGNPFDLLKGYWTGGGTVTPPKGNAEKVSCRVTYTGDGGAFTQNMRCAGTDYKFNTSSQLTYNGGKINGTWAETTYDASGTVDGSATGNTIHARINGNKFSGRMSINISGSSHTVNIVQLDKGSGSYRPAAAISLHR